MNIRSYNTCTNENLPNFVESGNEFILCHMHSLCRVKCTKTNPTILFSGQTRDASAVHYFKKIFGQNIDPMCMFQTRLS